MQTGSRDARATPFPPAPGFTVFTSTDLPSDFERSGVYKRVYNELTEGFTEARKVAGDT